MIPLPDDTRRDEPGRDMIPLSRDEIRGEIILMY